ncbi:hypothetical protein K438DRAFT_1772463 [Mycena galopus ATCC 62051]|nr:hypothetical protein K438DRAFT_1772463 [Mycena galopus ATCC 62051]
MWLCNTFLAFFALAIWCFPPGSISQPASWLQLPGAYHPAILATSLHVSRATAIVVTTKTPLEGRKPHCGALGRLTVLLLWITIVANPASTHRLFSGKIFKSFTGNPISTDFTTEQETGAHLCLPVRGAAHALSSLLPPQKVSLLRRQLFRQYRKNLAPGPGPEERTVLLAFCAASTDTRPPTIFADSILAAIRAHVFDARGPPIPSHMAKDFAARSCHAGGARSGGSIPGHRRLRVARARQPIAVSGRDTPWLHPLALVRWFFSTTSLAPQSLSFCLVHDTQQSWRRAAGSFGRKSSVLFSRNVRSHSEELPPPFLPPTLEFPPQKNSFTATLHPRRKNLAERSFPYCSPFTLFESYTASTDTRPPTIFADNFLVAIRAHVFDTCGTPPLATRSRRIHSKTQALPHVDTTRERMILAVLTRSQSELPFAYSARYFIVKWAVVLFACSQSIYPILELHKRLNHTCSCHAGGARFCPRSSIAQAHGEGENENDADPRASSPPMDTLEPVARGSRVMDDVVETKDRTQSR